MTSCRPFRRASLPSLGDTTPALVFRSPCGRALPRTGLLELVTRYLQPGNWSVETTGSPTFLGNPRCALALLFDPGRTDASGHAMRRRGPRCVHDEGSRIRTFEAQSHGFGTGCLRFAGRVAPTPRKTRFRLLAKLFRTGLTTRRVPSKGFTAYPTWILLSQVQRSARTQYWFLMKWAKRPAQPVICPPIPSIPGEPRTARRIAWAPSACNGGGGRGFGIWEKMGRDEVSELSVCNCRGAR